MPQPDGMAFAALATPIVAGGGLGAAVTHQPLDGGQIRTGIEQITAEGSSEVMRREGRDLGLLPAPVDRSVETAVREGAVNDPASPIYSADRRSRLVAPMA
ncbi:hypothetical protein LRD18_11905 [Halorhodospira halochloris]|nr:hypothetical protein [Halorhodospira halochloris]MCG5531548.1 hypothetical protein [Halorhodospira halochloris]